MISTVELEKKLAFQQAKTKAARTILDAAYAAYENNDELTGKLLEFAADHLLEFQQWILWSTSECDQF